MASREVPLRELVKKFKKLSKRRNEPTFETEIKSECEIEIERDKEGEDNEPHKQVSFNWRPVKEAAPREHKIYLGK